MPRTTNTEVAEILDTSLDTGALDAHIDAANIEVDRIAAADPSLTTATLTTIERFLAAAYASVQDPRAESQSSASRSVSYDRTSYFETAARLDPTGTLTNASKPAASVSVPDAKGIDD